MRNSKYSRHYCENCKLIYSKETTLLRCTKCNSFLGSKSFNPWPSSIAGALILVIAIATLLVDNIPIIWIGGFIFGISLMIRGSNQWSEINAMEERKEVKPEVKAKSGEELITCGACGNKNIIRKGLGYTELICQKCNRKSKVFT